MAVSRNFTVLAVAGLLTGCGLSTGSPGPASLAYDVPDPNPVSYAFTDSSRFTVESPMGSMAVNTNQQGTAELDFRRQGDGFRVQLRFSEFQGVFDNPMQGAVRADQTDMEGTFLLQVDPRGVVTVSEAPEISSELEAMVGPESLPRPFFAQLPARSAGFGDTWVDTVSYDEESGWTRSTTTTITTSTLEADTVVDGRRLLRIRTESELQLQVSGMTEGVDIEQDLSGASTGYVLWDPAASVLVERNEEGRLEGTLEVPGVDAPTMPVRVTMRQHVSLR